MQEQIKQLRVDIDGISQLVKELCPKQKYIVDIALIPKNIDLEKWDHIFREANYALIDSSKSEVNSKFPEVRSIPKYNKEIDKCYDSLILAKAWLGKVSQELGSETPYKNDGNRKTVEDIELIADTSKIIEALNKHPEITNTFKGLNWKESTYIEKIDKLKEEISFLILKVDEIAYSEKLNITRGMYCTYVKNYLTEARFWLGFELQRIKEEAEFNKTWNIEETR